MREVGGAPTFPLAIYAAYPSAGDGEVLAPALRGLRIVVTAAAGAANVALGDGRAEGPPRAPAQQVGGKGKRGRTP